MDALEQLRSRMQNANNTRINNFYIYGDKITAYIRITSRMINGEVTQTIDIGSVSVDPKNQKQGVFREFLEGVEEIAESFDRTVYIESVLSKFLARKLSEYGYISNHELCPSFHKKP